MKNVIVRALSGAIYVAIMVGAVLAGGGWLAALLSVFATIGIYEFKKMTCQGKYPRFTTLIDIATAVTAILSVDAFMHLDRQAAVTLGAVSLILLMVRIISELYSRHDNPVGSITRSMASLVYIALPLALVLVLYYALASSHLLLALLIFIWVNDTGAFCVGCTLGRHKLFERISPKKTWEGFFGGMLFCIGAALLLRGCFAEYFDFISYPTICLLAALTSVFATFGDLFESLVKRTSHVKDSGSLIPGHGGILDRIDSLLLVVPMAVVFFLLNI